MALPIGTSAIISLLIANMANGSANTSGVVTNDGTGGNPHFNGTMVTVRIRTGSVAPSAGGAVNVYLLSFNDANEGTDDWDGTTTSGFVIDNAPLLGSLIVTAATNKDYVGVFDTTRLGVLSQEFGIAIENRTGQTLDSSAPNHSVRHRFWTPDG